MKHNYFISVLLACIIQATAIAQFNIPVQKTIGGRDEDHLTSMYITNDGGLIAGGYSSSNKSGNKTENSRGYSDYWVVKMDGRGKIQWDKTIGGSNDDYLHSLQQTNDGGYILGGYSYSSISGEKTENNRGAYYTTDYWIVKLDSLGNIQWDKTIGGSVSDLLSSLQQTSDGGYILGGDSYSDISGEKTENSRGGDDYWVIKLDSLGKIQWDKTIGGSNEDDLSFLRQTSDGGYIIGGQSLSNISGEKTENSRGDLDYWVVKLDSFGTIQLDKTIGGYDYDGLYSLQQTSDGGYILGGSSSSNISGEKTENSRGLWDYWVVKLDNLGKIQWDKTIGGSDFDFFHSLQQTIEGGYILAGSSSSNISGEKTENSRGSNDYWVVKLDKRGKIQWDKTIGGSDNDALNRINEVSKNRYVLGGSSASEISGDKTDTSRGQYDYWIVSLEYDSIVLPVTIINLKAYQQNNIVKVAWTSLTEINVANYEIQRSSDAVNFTIIGKVPATGNGIQQKDYSFNDVQPLQGNNYYRIRVTDNDGKITYTNTVLVNITGKTTFIIYPVPAKDVLHVQVSGSAIISLTNQAGKVLLTKTIEGAGVINVAALPAGFYYVKNNATGEVQKVVVTK